ncbi:chaperone, partial [Pseudomonas syringae pv. japonica str. M301072]
HHKVAITDGAIIAAAKLSHRYITDRQLPDKAIGHFAHYTRLKSTADWL